MTIEKNTEIKKTRLKAKKGNVGNEVIISWPGVVTVNAIL